MLLIDTIYLLNKFLSSPPCIQMSRWRKHMFKVGYVQNKISQTIQMNRLNEQTISFSVFTPGK